MICDDVQMRDLWSTIRNVHTRVADFIRYRRITTNMNEVRAPSGNMAVGLKEVERNAAGSL